VSLAQPALHVTDQPGSAGAGAAGPGRQGPFDAVKGGPTTRAAGR
jgi:hypothetical protein